MSLAAGDLVMADAYGDHRRPAAWNLYVVLGVFAEAGPVTTTYRVRPVYRGGAHSKDKVLRAAELIPLADYGMRIKTINRERLFMVLEAHGTAKRSWHTPGYPGPDTFTAVDPEALPFINFVDATAKEPDRP